jgi:hypothetical protein
MFRSEYSVQRGMDLLAVWILALISSFSSLVLLISVHKYLIFLRPPVPSTLNVHISFISFSTILYCWICLFDTDVQPYSFSSLFGFFIYLWNSLFLFLPYCLYHLHIPLTAVICRKYCIFDLYWQQDYYFVKSYNVSLRTMSQAIFGYDLDIWDQILYLSFSTTMSNHNNGGFNLFPTNPQSILGTICKTYTQMY